MNCHEARRHWHLYYDSEGTPDLFQQINEHLESCAACADWYRRQEVLEEEITRRLAAGEETAELWASILPSPVVPPTSGTTRRMWLAVAALAAACVLAALVWYFQPSDPTGADLAALTAQQHQQILADERRIEFRSQSDLEVENFLRTRVTFPVRCPPRKDTGFLVSGAGTCRLDGQTAAYLVGTLDGGPVSIFILSREALSRFERNRHLLQRDRTIDCVAGPYRLAMAAIDRNVVLVVGSTSCERLTRVLRAYGTYPDHHGGAS